MSEYEVKNKDFVYYHLQAINERTIEMQKEINKLKYLFELKKSREVSNTIKSMSDDDKKIYISRQKMYLSKIADGTIKVPKDETLKYYNIIKEENQYKIKE